MTGDAAYVKISAIDVQFWIPHYKDACRINLTQVPVRADDTSYVDVGPNNEPLKCIPQYIPGGYGHNVDQVRNYHELEAEHRKKIIKVNLRATEKAQNPE